MLSNTKNITIFEAINKDRIDAMAAKKQSKSDYEIKDHQLYFTRFGVLLKLFSENKVSKKKRWMQFKIFFFALFTQVFMLLQQLFYARRFRKVDFQENPPIFILGHWRSGTTHLHYLMAQDRNLGFASNFNSFMINFSLLGRGWLDKFLQQFMPKKRPMDNVAQTIFSPSEEDQAVANMSIASGIHTFFFPKNRSYFNKYTTFRDCSPKEKEKWKKAYDEMLRIVAVSNKGKRLVIKSPGNTARPTELLELYPNAKFVFIHRNPYEVYRSTRKLHKRSTESQYLQDMTEDDIHDLIFENYTELLKAYLHKKDSIPEGNLVEISFDELNADAEGTMQHIYETLNISGFEDALPHIRAYLASVEDYTRNSFNPLAPALVERIQKEWGFTFQTWGYDFTHSEATIKSSKTRSL